ncbi:MAG: pyridoxal phosphate-dependent class II aminotransferase [Bacteroidales bacterium]|nr:pyridoxal phosphate-dependent class II aminotransferase [Bacteroidales bacterium]
MIVGHGDDLWKFVRPIVANFSSNVFSRVDLTPLKQHLASRLDVISNYPEPEPYTLEAAIASRLCIPAEAVCVTSGATEAIYLIAQAFLGSRSAIVQPTFSEYKDACRLHEHILTDASSISGQAPDGRPYDMIWLCNPNNPTGSVMAAGKVREMVLDKRKTFVIDQSYGFFTGEPLMTAAEAVATGNVLQLHSMTKRYAMPGLRLGYIVGSPQLMERLRNVRMPWIVNALAIEAGLYLTEHPDTAPIDKPALLAEAQRLRAELNGLPAIEVRPTSTHFMLCEIKTGTAADLKDWLMEHHGLLIRDASNFEGLGQGHFRIATQTREENDLLISAIKEFMQK